MSIFEAIKSNPISGAKTSPKETVSPTEAQVASARAKSYLGKTTILSEIANKYSKRQLEKQHREGHLPSGEDLYSYAFNALNDIYSSNANTLEGRSHILWQYGDDAYAFSTLIDEARPQLDKTEDILNKPETLRWNDRLELAYQSLKFLSSHEPLEEKLKFLEKMDVTKENIKKLKESAVLTAGLIIPGDLILLFSQALPAVAGAQMDLEDPGVKAAVIGAYALDAALLAFNTYMNIKDIKKLGISPNFFASSGYRVAQALFPKSKRAENIGIILPSVAPSIVAEVGHLPFLLVPGSGAPVTIFRNVASAANQVIQAGVAMNMYWREEKEFVKS